MLLAGMKLITNLRVDYPRLRDVSRGFGLVGRERVCSVWRSSGIPTHDEQDPKFGIGRDPLRIEALASGTREGCRP